MQKMCGGAIKEFFETKSSGGKRKGEHRGCQIFHGTGYQKQKNVPNQLKMYQMVIKYPECP
jgi:hypothetical protein